MREELFHDWVYKFEAPDYILKRSLNILNGAVWYKNAYNSSTFADRFKEKDARKLRKWFNRCLEEVRSDLDLSCERLAVSQIWGNKSEKGHWHHTHSHYNSWASGILYLTPSSAQTWFSKPTMWEQPGLEIVPDAARYHLYKHPTTVGTLIIFPSTLEHSVNEHDLDDPRFSISFNSYPSGFIGAPGQVNHALELRLRVSQA